MTLPHLTVLTCTFGRVSHLEEAIACFQAQDYQGPREMIVFNTFRRQQLCGDFPDVRIINAPTRPPSLGACRNMAISHAVEDSLIVILDDDDLIMPWHLSSFANALTDADEWLWQSHQWFLQGWQFQKIVTGSPNVLAFRKTAWRAVEGYPNNLDVGEDRVFLQKMQGRPGTGKRIQLAPAEVSFMYHWGNSVYHVSGMGDDVPGRPSGHQRIGAYTEGQANNGFIPVGRVQLQPALLRDYPKLATEFLDRASRFEQKKNDAPVIQPGVEPPYVADIEPLKPLTVDLVYIYVPNDPEHADLAGRFLACYTKCPPGFPHRTVLVCQGKGPDAAGVKLIRGLPQCTVYVHDDSGLDIGGFLAVSKTLTSDFALYCGGKTYMKRGGWLIRMAEAWKRHGPGFYGSLSSYEVSPHLNTSGFWCSPQMMVKYPHQVATTAERYNFEHGPYAMWRFCIRLGLPVKLVTWCGEYDWPDWRKPDNIYRRGDQSNCLTYFKHTQLYDEANPDMRPHMARYADNITDIYFLKCQHRNNLKLEPYDTFDNASWHEAMENMARLGILAGKR